MRLLPAGQARALAPLARTLHGQGPRAGLLFEAAPPPVPSWTRGGGPARAQTPWICLSLLERQRRWPEADAFLSRDWRDPHVRQVGPFRILHAGGPRRRRTPLPRCPETALALAAS